MADDPKPETERSAQRGAEDKGGAGLAWDVQRGFSYLVASLKVDAGIRHILLTIGSTRPKCCNFDDLVAEMDMRETKPAPHQATVPEEFLQLVRSGIRVHVVSVAEGTHVIP